MPQLQPYITRTMEPHLAEMAEWFPVISLTGPRQSGKSTLVQHAFPGYSYVNLEDPQIRAVALDDPVSFIQNHPEKLIVDEAQYAPDLFSMIQVVSDKRGTTGQYVLTGSQNFLMMKHIGQSLAGRVGLLKLLPFSYHEIQKDPSITMNAEEFLLKGGYPRLYETGMPPAIYFVNYIETYIERDVAGLLDVRNKASFRTLLKVAAHSVGSIVNMAAMSNEIGASVPTVKSWLSILESSYLVFMLQPYHANTRKRLTKSPKLYFYDTGLLCHLLGISTLEQLEAHPKFGEIFENLIIEETLKSHLNATQQPDLYFYRDDSKREIDLIDLTEASHPQAIEIKSSRTYHRSYARHLNTVGEELGIPAEDRMVVMRSGMSYRAEGVKITDAPDYLMALDTDYSS